VSVAGREVVLKGEKEVTEGVSAALNANAHEALVPAVNAAIVDGHAARILFDVTRIDGAG